MKNEKKLLTISVAAYNLGEMIEGNLQSFVDCNNRDKIEVIVTDDGSSDNTVELAKKIEEKYPNTIKVIKKKNEGPGSTVNSGIQNATGKYFRMVDGDDWINSKELDELVDVLERIESDLVVCDYDVFNDLKKQVTKKFTFDLPKMEEFNFDDYFEKIPYQMHSLIFKTSIIKDNSIKIDNCFYTDTEYVLYPIIFAKTVFYYNKSIYVYRVAQENQSINPHSMMKNIDQHKLVLLNNIQFYKKNLLNLSIEKKYFVSKRIAKMAQEHIKILLLFKENKKNEIKEIISICKCDEYIYKEFKNDKIVNLLIISHYFLLNILSNYLRQKKKI